MKEQDLLKDIKMAAIEEQAKLDGAADALFDQLAAGTISDADKAKLEKLAETDESVALMLEAFSPLGEAFKEQVTDSIMAMLPAQAEAPVEEPEVQRVLRLDTEPTLFERIKEFFTIQPMVMVPALAGMAAVFVAIAVPTSSVDQGGPGGSGAIIGTNGHPVTGTLPVYGVEFSSGDSMLRSGNSAVVSAGAPQIAPGSSFQIVLRPETQSQTKPNAKLFIARGDAIESVHSNPRISETGAIQIKTQVGKELPAEPGIYRVIVLVHTSGVEPSLDQMRAVLGPTGTAQRDGWQIFQTNIEVTQ